MLSHLFLLSCQFPEMNLLAVLQQCVMPNLTLEALDLVLGCLRLQHPTWPLMAGWLVSAQSARRASYSVTCCMDSASETIRSAVNCSASQGCCCASCSCCCCRPGILCALMGTSGAGKTTLMDVLAGRKTCELLTIALSSLLLTLAAAWFAQFVKVKALFTGA